MKQITFTIKQFKHWKLFVVVGVLLIAFFLTASKAWPENTFLSEVFAGLFGAAIVAIITMLLLEDQTKSESEKDRQTMIFQKKLEIYQTFLSSLNTIVANKHISDIDKINLQFQVAYISIHTESARLKAISEQVVSIIHKLELDNNEPIDNNVYTELCKMSVEFHNELYDNKWTTIDPNLQTAIKNFDCLKIPERKKDIYKRLLWVEDCISLYPLKTQIIGYSHLIIKIHILPKVVNECTLSSDNLFLWLKTSVRSGDLYMYIENDTQGNEISRILDFVRIAKTNILEERKKELSKKPKEESAKALKFIENLLEGNHKKEEQLLDTSVIKNAVKYVDYNRNMNPNSDIICIYDLLDYLSPIWVEENCAIVRRNIKASTDNQLQIIKYEAKKMKFQVLNNKDIFAIPVGSYFHQPADVCYLVYSPLANLFYLSLPKEVEDLQDALIKGKEHPVLQKLLQYDNEAIPNLVTTDTFCTLHLLLNEKCNFHCKYCYSAEGRSSQELDIKQIEPVLRYFLSAERKAVKDRTIMFMGGGEPVLSWNLLKEATFLAESISQEQGTILHFSLTTNGSIMTNEMLEFLKEHNFTVQISFEILPDVQNEQRGSYDIVAKNLQLLTEYGINNYVRSTITEKNVDRIPEMVEHCHKHFPKVKKMSCQQVVDPAYFTTKELVDDFFDRYFNSFQKGVHKATEYGIALRSSSSHLLNYSKRERFCYNLLCLTPFGTLTMCPDVSSPKEKDYTHSLIGEIKDGEINFDQQAFKRLSDGSIHTIDKCKQCFARWNCGSGCPSSRRVYKEEIFDAICNHYRRMLVNSLMEELSKKYEQATQRDFYKDMISKL